MSIWFPRIEELIAEHSICHPGNPESLSSPSVRDTSPVASSQRKMCFEFCPIQRFHNAKSAGCFLPSCTSTRAPEEIWSSVFPDKFPYGVGVLLSTEK